VINWKHVFVALLVGIAVGCVGGSKAAHIRMHAWKNGAMLERFSRELKLTPDEKEKMSRILDAKRDQISALRNEIHLKFEEVRNSSKEEIRKILTPEQQEKFDKLEAKWESVWQKKRGQWPEK
jgi:Spy/CpxP family protein refolding chaperone